VDRDGGHGRVPGRRGGEDASRERQAEGALRGRERLPPRPRRRNRRRRITSVFGRVRCRGGRGGEGTEPGAYGKGEELGGSWSPRMESSPEGGGLHFA
jgi:hypothetical protein